MATIIEGDFEWDSAKATQNVAKHGVSFAEAATVFADPLAIYLDDGSATERIVVIGTSLRDRLLYVVHVQRGERGSTHQCSARDTRGTRSLRNRRYIMKNSAQRTRREEAEPVRVLGRGLRAQRGVRMTMRSLRDAAGKTQVDVAKSAHIDQADVSRLERKQDFDDCEVATLRRYVESIGGKLELVAVFGNKKITLAGVP